MSHEWTFPAADSGDLPAYPHLDRSFSIAPAAVSPEVIADAVIVIPGIMGTELIDMETGKKLWGLDPDLIARMWVAPSKYLTPLAVDPEHNTVRPGHLLRTPTFAPFLRGIDPYRNLVRALEAIVRDPSAVSQFGYDWRLPVRYNARLLAERIDSHVTWWRKVTGHTQARVHLVAHSMGGLLCHELSTISGATDTVGAIVTLGTPFAGAAKAAVMLGTGKGAPLPAHRLREVAVTMPGIYDLLPSYRCLDSGTDVTRLSIPDMVAVGAHEDLARAAFADRAARAETSLPRHLPIIGVEQATTCVLRIDSGQIDGLRDTVGVDLVTGELLRDGAGNLRRFPGLGDGTVPRDSALPPRDPARPDQTPRVSPLPQQHGPIAKTQEAITKAKDFLLHRDSDLGPRLGDGDVGIDTPDIVTVGTEFDIAVRGPAKPNDIRCQLTQIGTRQPRRADAHRRDGNLVVSATVYRPGLYRVAVAGSGTSAVEQIVLAVDPAQ
ncbi:hypothetical protein [Nocardia sp. NPDC058705]|uniref:lipase/acyltransferase domain-containing protein n=1 Tax=Nocardia sp. NPDC058705 TaxID=3346609 RepID=UPI00369DD4EB